MMPRPPAALMYDFETHNLEGIRRAFESGTDPNAVYRELPLLESLITMYTRSPRFSHCVRVFVEYGLKYHDEVLLSLLCDDATKLEKLIIGDPTVIQRTWSRILTYTPLLDGTALHICAEFDLLDCARILVAHGADVNARAGKDENGFGGQTPIFHTVNQNGNHSLRMMRFLLSQNASLDVRLKGIVWGKGFDWETFIPSVDPLSYAMMGLLPMMHRDEKAIAMNVSLLLKHKYGMDYHPPNVPCKYLSPEK